MMKANLATLLLLTLSAFDFKVEATWGWPFIFRNYLANIEARLTERFTNLSENLSASIAGLQSTLNSMEEQLAQARNCCCSVEVKPCPDGWQEYDTSYYCYVTEPLSWYDARDDCKLMGGFLAEVESELEDDFIGGLKSSNVWYGGTDEENEGEWIWDNSQVALVYNDWAPNIVPVTGRPDQNCLIHVGWWYDKPCGEPNSYVCEKLIE